MSGRRVPRRARAWFGLALAAGALAAAAPGLEAQTRPTFPLPWSPHPGDSLSRYAGEARALLRGSKDASLGERELRAFSLMDRVARAYFQSLGPRGMRSAPGIHAVLDTLRLTAEVTQATRHPSFALVHFFNPHFENYASLAYLYWFLGEDVRSQPVHLASGHDADLEVFWTGEEAFPYEAAILHYRGHGVERRPIFASLRMVSTGLGWVPAQVGAGDLELGGAGSGAWTDLDGDGTFELVTWTRGELDPLFSPCVEIGCPVALTQRIFVRAPGRGFTLYEARPVASPLAALASFVRALVDGDAAAARSLAANPRVVEEARALGWDREREAGAFRVQRASGERWPRAIRLVVRGDAAGEDDVTVEAEMLLRDGVWRVERLVAPRGERGRDRGTRSLSLPDPNAGGRE